jgi:uncharacterized membrane protein
VVGPTASAGERLSAALAPEERRFLVASAVGAPCAGVVGAMAVTGRGTPGGYLFLVLLGLVLWCLTYVVLTLAVFLPVPPDRLAELVQPRPATLWVRVLRGGSDGPVLAVQFAALALAAAVVLPRLDEALPGAEGLPVVLLCAAAVVSCWAVLTTTYAVHYMRLHRRDGGLRFRGADEPGFSDYCYLAVAVATTFGTTDVDVTGPGVRRVITGHGVLAFAFNSVILALLLTALTS